MVRVMRNRSGTHISHQGSAVLRYDVAARMGRIQALGRLS